MKNLYVKLKILLSLVLVLTLFTSSTSIVSAETANENLKENLKIRAEYNDYPATLEHYSYLDPESNFLLDMDIKRVTKLAKKITKDATTDYEKSKAIHDWVSNNIWYDWDYFANGALPASNYDSVNDILDKRVTVCEGYARVTIALNRAIGIPAMRVSGIANGALGEQSHLWCEVYVDGRWVIVDTTWDSNNRYSDGKFSEQQLCNDTYFDCSIEKISESHYYFDNFLVPFSYEDYNETATQVTIPIGTTDILEGTFTNNITIKKVVLPDTIINLDSSTFRRCENLQTVVLPKSLKTIGYNAFEACYKLKELTIPDTVTNIEGEAFAGCDSLTKLIIPSSVKKIGKNAFGKIVIGHMDRNCKNITETHFPKNLTIYCEKDSVAHKYAIKNKIKFKII